MRSMLLFTILPCAVLLCSSGAWGATILNTGTGWQVTRPQHTLTRVDESGPLAGWLNFRSPKWKGPQSDWPAFECRNVPRDWSAYDRLALPVLCDSMSGTHLFAVYITGANSKLQKGAHWEYRLQHPQARMIVLPLKQEFKKKRIDTRNIEILHIYTENPPANQNLYLGPPMLLTPQDQIPELPQAIAEMARKRKLSLLSPLILDMQRSLDAISLSNATERQKTFWLKRKQNFLGKLAQGRFGEFLLTHGTAIPDYQSLLALPRIFSQTNSQMTGSRGDILLGYAYPTQKVLPKVPVFQPLPTKLVLDAARGENESLQLILMPLQQALENVTLSFSAFNSDTHRLPSKVLQAIPVGFVETRFNPPNGSPHVGSWPDPLLTFMPKVNILPGEAQPFWIKASIPANQPSGTYRGNVTMQIDGHIVLSVPLTINVRNFTLPNHSLLPLAITFGPTVRKHAHRMETPTNHWRKHMRLWHEMLTGYYLNFDHLYWSAPDKAYFPFWEKMQGQGKPAFFNLGNFHLATNSPQDNYGLQDVIDRIEPIYLKAKKRGLLKHAYIYGADEAQKATFPSLERAASILHQHFPDVPLMTTAADQSYGTGSPARSIDRFCPLISNYNPNTARLARKQGREVWWYISNTIAPPYPNNFVESDAMEIRLLMGIMAHKYDVDGFLYYYTSIWNTDTPITTGPHTGMDARSYPRYNGDGNWCYQGPDHTPLPTIRLENFRDGLEDYAYLKILEQRLMAARSKNLNPDWQQRAQNALEIPPGIVADLTHYTRHPKVLLSWKTHLAQLIEEAPKADPIPMKLEASLALRKERRKAMEQNLYPPTVVQPPTGYNSWPMIQSLGQSIVCAYSRGLEHTIADGQRGTYARFSEDRGKTWSDEVLVVNTPQWGNVPIGKGLDSQGNMLLWVRAWGDTHHHDLFRTSDGINFQKIATIAPDPMPMQITDIIQVPNVGLMALWFTGDYSACGRNAWGTLTSSDDGQTWTQHVVQKNLKREDWPTEPAPVYLGNGRILAIARTECKEGAPETAQFQLESTDYGETWSCRKTNITDVAFSTPSLILDREKGLVTNYYYIRGKGKLMRRIARIEEIFGHPEGWPKPELLAFSSDSFWDAGNVNATVQGNRHIVSFYAGNETHTSVQVIVVPAP